MEPTWDKYGQWDKIAQLESLHEVKSAITGSRKAWRPNFVPPALEYVFDYAADEQRAAGTNPCVLDFGCGLARNAPMLRKFFPRVVGVDLPEMIERLKQARPDVIGNLYDQLYVSVPEATSRETFSVVYDSVVLQHIINRSVVSEIIDALAAVKSLRTFVSLSNFGAVPTHFGILEERRWVIWHKEDERLSFEGAPHTVTIFRRW